MRQWTFDLRPSAEQIMVVRWLTLLPDYTGTPEAPVVQILPPGSLRFFLQRSGAAVPNVGHPTNPDGTYLAAMGVPWSVFLIVTQDDFLRVVVQTRSMIADAFAETMQMRMLFEGDILRSRNLPRDLEVGHTVPTLAIADKGAAA